MKQTIAMEHVTYTVGGRKILSDFSFELTRGENLTILGRSGVGKTTILKLLLGLIEPDDGKILIDGVPLTGKKEREIRRMTARFAIVFQGGALFDSMTVGENVGYRLLEKKRPLEEVERVVREKLSFVGLGDTIDLYPAELSGGMKKRVAIARAIAADPDVILLDEPTTGLDPIGVTGIQTLITSLQRQGKSTLMVTHDLATAFAVSNRFIFVHEGRKIFDGPPQEMERSGHPAIRRFFSPGDFPDGG
ncbi:MAG: ABC transporter ATP-binding protein [Desulfuromonadia bacterium]